MIVQVLSIAIELALYALLVAASLVLLARVRWARARGPVPPTLPASIPTPAPLVTIQLPLRNEHEMVAPLLASVAALTWPRERLEVQILDDSDDETIAEVDRVAAELRGRGLAIDVVRRADWRGYKAGALALGLSRARGELVLVLDADFRPEPGLLAELSAALADDPALAFVQARWGFRNERTLLTRVQAAILDALFAVEQPMLGERGAPVQFNGTAGLWRRRAIDEVGGWDTSDDALTEDLDLSFRAHERGLAGRTLPSIAVSTELPPTMAAFRAQQARWVRGAALTLRTLGRRLATRASLAHARVMLGHLLRHARQPLFVAALLRLVVVALGRARPVCPAPVGIGVVALAACAVTAYLGTARARLGRGRAGALLLGPALLLLSAGLAPTLSAAFVGGVLGRRAGGFQRTPKGRAARAWGRAAVGTLGLAALLGFAAWRFFVARDLVGVAAAGFSTVALAWAALP